MERDFWVPSKPAKNVPLELEGCELEQSAKAKAAGAKWSPYKRLWFVKYGNIAGTALENHLQVDEKDM